MLRSEGFLHLGQLMRSISSAHFSDKTVQALASIADATRNCSPLHCELLDKLVLRFDVWRRLEHSVQSSLLALIHALASSDEGVAEAVNLHQRLFDAARKCGVLCPASLPPSTPLA